MQAKSAFPKGKNTAATIAEQSTSSTKTAVEKAIAKLKTKHFDKNRGGFKKKAYHSNHNNRSKYYDRSDESD